MSTDRSQKSAIDSAVIVVKPVPKQVRCLNHSAPFKRIVGSYYTDRPLRHDDTFRDSEEVETSRIGRVALSRLVVGQWSEFFWKEFVADPCLINLRALFLETLSMKVTDPAPRAQIIVGDRYGERFVYGHRVVHFLL